MTARRTDRVLISLTFFGGLLSAFIMACLAFLAGHYAVPENSRLLYFGQAFFAPGSLFGAIISCCFALRGYLHGVRKFLVLTVASAIAYAVAFWVAVGVEVYSPFLNNQERGDVSGQALFVGGMTGALCTLSAFSLLLNSGITWQNRMFRALCWTPAGGFLGVAGWALGPSLGVALGHIVHSMNLPSPTETFQNAKGQASYFISTWAAWQAGMGFALGLVVRRKNSTA